VDLTGDFVDSDFAGDFVDVLSGDGLPEEVPEELPDELSEAEPSEEVDFEPEESLDDPFFAEAEADSALESARLSFR